MVISRIGACEIVCEPLAIVSHLSWKTIGDPTSSDTYKFMVVRFGTPYSGSNDFVSYDRVHGNN